MMVENRFRERACGETVFACRGLVAAVCMLWAAATPFAGAADFPQGLLLHYNFDDSGSSTYVSDRSGKGHHGRGVGTSWTSGGRMNGGWEFAASNSCVNATNSPALKLARASYCAWFRTLKTAPGPRHVFDKKPPTGFALGLTGTSPDSKNAGKVFFAAGGASCVGDSVVTDGSWHHAVGVSDGTNLLLYVDGVLQKQTAACKGGIPANDANLAIGLNRAGSGADKNRSFDGVIDEAMVFGRPLAAAEVAAVMAATKPKFTKEQVARRLAELKDLYDRGLILQEFYERKVRECEVNP